MSESVRERERKEETSDKEFVEEDTIQVDKPVQQVDLDEFEEVIDTNVFKMLENEVARLVIEDESKVKPRYPEHINKPWFYVRPHKNFEDKWLDIWSEILLIYCRLKRKFVVNVLDLMLEEPFSSKDGINGLDLEDLRSIVARLVEKGKAKWMDDKKESAVVFWENPEDMLAKILRFNRETGFKYVTLHLLDKIWPDLPIEEKINLLKKLVDSKKGVWVIEDYAVKLVNGA